MIRLDRHPQGPRVYLLGRRVHECQLGIVLAVAAILWALVVHGVSGWTAGLLVAGIVLTVKDARDLFPATRDTGAWRLGMHRRFAPLRAMRDAEGLPALTGAVAFTIGAVNLVSALTPNLSWRGELVLSFLPVRAVPVLHTLAVPASFALLCTAFYLRRRRRRAFHAAFVLLVLLGGLNLFKGLDFEEAALSWAGAAILWWGRDAFTVAPARVHARMAAVAAGLLGVALAAGSYFVWLSSDTGTTARGALADTIRMLAWTHRSGATDTELSALTWLFGALTVVLILIVAYAFFRPLEPSRELPEADERAAALDIVRTHGSDTLAYFKLRRDMQYLFTADGSAFLGYRIERTVMIVAGDPLGPEEALPELVRSALAFAELHDLRLAVLGASGRSLPLWRAGGLRSLYIGDEAIVATDGFSLEGRAVRKLRQAVTRLDKAGYSAEVVSPAELDPAAAAELEHISSLWREGKPERGFSMAMDTLRPHARCESLVVLARDETGKVRAFLHFVPSYGRPAMSLSFMRRDRGTPNGLTEFLVVNAIELLGERGIRELSLNFAAFGRLLERPSGRVERVLGRLVVLGSRYFQMESLYRFNAKFSPRWEPRYFLYEGLLGLPRAGVAALLAEGHLPRLPLVGGRS
jgi:lysyl-tRNA synthetase class 2